MSSGAVPYDGHVAFRPRIQPADLPKALQEAEALVAKSQALIPKEFLELEYADLKNASFYGVKATLYPVRVAERSPDSGKSPPLTRFSTANDERTNDWTGRRWR